MPDLFDSVQPASFKSKLQSAVQRLATSNIFIGTSSWKYSGWTGLIYDEQRYHYRGKFAETRFERDCLAEYAETFKTVCVDAAYYQFPSAKYLTGLVQKVPDDFLFTFKVTDDITLKRFTNLPRFGIKAGKPNDNFLNAELFINAFLKPCEPFRSTTANLVQIDSRNEPDPTDAARLLLDHDLRGNPLLQEIHMRDDTNGFIFLPQRFQRRDRQVQRV